MTDTDKLTGLIETILAVQTQRNKVRELRTKLDVEAEDLRKLELNLFLQASNIKQGLE